MTKVKPIKDTTLECMNDLIGDLEHYEQWFNNEEHCKDELKWLKGWSERVKKALTELQAIKEAKPSEAMKCLEGIEYVADVLKVNHKIGSRDCANQEIKEMVDRLNYRIPTIKSALLRAEKLEKAWKVIKEKGVDVSDLKCCDSVEAYNIFIGTIEYQLTEEEFELIKEMIE